jgi:hypothetical protein
MIADSYKQQIPPLRYAPVGMTQYVDDGGGRIERRRQKQIPFGDDNQKGKEIFLGVGDEKGKREFLGGGDEKGRRRSSWGWRRESQERTSWGWRRESQNCDKGVVEGLGELLLFEGEGEFFPFGEEGGALGAELF